MKKYQFAQLLIACLSLLIWCNCGCGTPTPGGSREVAESYLSAWENGDYEQMCGYLEYCGRPTWIETMEVFPIPVRDWQIEMVEVEASEAIVRYTVEMPDPGCIVGAAIDEYPWAAAVLLDWTGNWIVWEDTLRLMAEDSEWKIKSSRETAECSNRLVSFVLGVGIYLATVAPIESPADRLVSVLALYAVEFDKSEAEMEELIPVFLEQWEAYQLNLR